MKKPSKMSNTERERRRKEVGRQASDKVAKSQQLNFRIEEKAIRELQELAFDKGLPVGTMIRDWVLERLLQEQLGTSQVNGAVLQTLNDVYTKLGAIFDNPESHAKGYLAVSEKMAAEFSAKRTKRAKSK